MQRYAMARNARINFDCGMSHGRVAVSNAMSARRSARIAQIPSGGHSLRESNAEVGCFLSHYAVWHRMVEQNIPAALILEDDFDLQANFKHRLGEYLSEAEGLDWNLMYLGKESVSISTIIYHNNNV